MSTGKTFIKRRGTTAIPNATVHDATLSYAALGLLAVLLARPDGSPSGYRALEGRGLGQKATLSALRELDQAGYRHQIRRSGPGGRLVTDTLICEVPTPRDEAEDYLIHSKQPPLIHNGHREATGAARSDQAKHGKAAGRTVRRSTVARSTVARPGTAQVLRTSKGSFTNVKNLEESKRAQECEHGERRGPDACALCRHSTGTDTLVPDVDAQTRAAGER